MIIGLTGGIAAGKSTVRQTLSSRNGLVTFDADSCVRHLLESDPQVKAGIRDLFGPRVLQTDGRPSRPALRELVFHDPEARRKLEGLLHPLVRAQWQAARERCAAAGQDFLADIPLLYETGAESFFDAVVVVACSTAAQLARLEARGISPATAQAMLASQLPLGQKIENAAFAIWNDGTLVALGRQTELLLKELFPD